MTAESGLTRRYSSIFTQLPRRAKYRLAVRAALKDSRTLPRANPYRVITTGVREAGERVLGSRHDRHRHRRDHHGTHRRCAQPLAGLR
jgi:hypothetical protein